MIRSALADQEGKTKRYEADVAIAQSLRDKETKQAEFNAAVQAKTAEAEQAGPLATAIARQRVTEQETRIDQVRKQQEVLVQEQEVARREKELQATVVKPAQAERKLPSFGQKARNSRRLFAPKPRPKSSSTRAPAKRRRSNGLAEPSGKSAGGWRGRGGGHQEETAGRG